MGILFSLLWFAFGVFQVIFYLINLGVLFRKDIPRARKHYILHGLGLIIYFIIFSIISQNGLFKGLGLVFIFVIPWLFIIHWYTIIKWFKTKKETDTNEEDLIF